MAGSGAIQRRPDGNQPPSDPSYLGPPRDFDPIQGRWITRAIPGGYDWDAAQQGWERQSPALAGLQSLSSGRPSAQRPTQQSYESASNPQLDRRNTDHQQFLSQQQHAGDTERAEGAALAARHRQEQRQDVMALPQAATNYGQVAPDPNSVMQAAGAAAGQQQELERIASARSGQERIEQGQREGAVIQAAHTPYTGDVATGSGGNTAVTYAGPTQQQEEAARSAAFARTKDNAANTARASLTGLSGELQARGMGGAGYEGGQIGHTLGREANTIGEGDRQQAEEELRRSAEVANMQYQGNITQRGQNLSTQTANANRRQQHNAASLQALQGLAGLRY